MLRFLLLLSGIALLAMTGLLSIFSLSKIGINDAEWAQVAQTGLPHGSGDFSWSTWRANDGSITPLFPYFVYHQAETPVQTAAEYRIGVARGFLFDFTCYQGRNKQDGIVRIYPALGPKWGASYHWVWTFLAFVLSIIAFIVRSRIRSSLISPLESLKE